MYNNKLYIDEYTNQEEDKYREIKQMVRDYQRLKKIKRLLELWEKEKK
jgi:hypothetical protein